MCVARRDGTLALLYNPPTLSRGRATGSDLECGHPLGANGIDAGTLEHYFLCSRLCRFVIGLCIR